MTTLTPHDLRRVVRIRHLAKHGELRPKREAAGVSLREAARAIGASPASMSRWENGETPSAGYALRIANLLRVLTGERL